MCATEEGSAECSCWRWQASPLKWKSFNALWTSVNGAQPAKYGLPAGLAFWYLRVWQQNNHRWDQGGGGFGGVCGLLIKATCFRPQNPGIDVNGVGSNPQTRLLSLLDRRRKELLSWFCLTRLLPNRPFGPSARRLCYCTAGRGVNHFTPGFYSCRQNPKQSYLSCLLLNNQIVKHNVLI